MHEMTGKSGWPSGLRRCVQVAVYSCRRGFESHSWHIFSPICGSYSHKPHTPAALSPIFQYFNVNAHFFLRWWSTLPSPSCPRSQLMYSIGLALHWNGSLTHCEWKLESTKLTDTCQRGREAATAVEFRSRLLQEQLPATLGHTQTSYGVKHISSPL